MKKRFIFLLFLIGCSSSDCPKGGDIEMFFLFDVSKPHLQHIDHSVKVAAGIYSNFTSTDNAITGIDYQTYRMSTIDRFGLKNQSPCNEIHDAQQFAGFRPKEKLDRPFIQKCLPDLIEHKGAVKTDLYGSIYNAYNAINKNEIFGKALFIFSDFEPDEDPNLKKIGAIAKAKDLIDLNGFTIYLFFSETGSKTKGTMIDNAFEMKQFLEDKGAKSVKIKNLSSVGVNSKSLEVMSQNMRKELIKSFIDCN